MTLNSISQRDLSDSIQNEGVPKTALWVLFKTRAFERSGASLKSVTRLSQTCKTLRLGFFSLPQHALCSFKTMLTWRAEHIFVGQMPMPRLVTSLEFAEIARVDRVTAEIVRARIFLQLGKISAANPEGLSENVRLASLHGMLTELDDCHALEMARCLFATRPYVALEYARRLPFKSHRHVLGELVKSLPDGAFANNPLALLMRLARELLQLDDPTLHDSHFKFYRREHHEAIGSALGAILKKIVALDVQAIATLAEEIRDPELRDYVFAELIPALALVDWKQADTLAQTLSEPEKMHACLETARLAHLNEQELKAVDFPALSFADAPKFLPLSRALTQLDIEGALTLVDTVNSPHVRPIILGCFVSAMIKADLNKAQLLVTHLYHNNQRLLLKERLFELVQALIPSSPECALQYAQLISEDWKQAEALAAIARACLKTDVQKALEIALSIKYPSAKNPTLIEVAKHLMQTDSLKALDLVQEHFTSSFDRLHALKAILPSAQQPSLALLDHAACSGLDQDVLRAALARGLAQTYPLEAAKMLPDSCKGWDLVYIAARATTKNLRPQGEYTFAKC